MSTLDATTRRYDLNCSALIHNERAWQSVIEWSLVPANAALMAAWGFIFSAVGLIVGFGGFWIAIRQLAAIKTETEASSAAIAQVQLKIASFDAAQECNEARSLILQIKKHLSEGDWPQILRGYEMLIESFLRLSHSNSQVGDDDRLLLARHTKDMATFCESIRRRLPNMSGSAVIKGQDMALRDFSDTMIKVTFSVMKDLQR